MKTKTNSGMEASQSGCGQSGCAPAIKGAKMVGTGLEAGECGKPGCVDAPEMKRMTRGTGIEASHPGCSHDGCVSGEEKNVVERSNSGMTAQCPAANEGCNPSETKEDKRGSTGLGSAHNCGHPGCETSVTRKIDADGRPELREISSGLAAIARF